MTHPKNQDIRIATVYTREILDDFKPIHMNFTRWLRISEALGKLGYKVDMIVNTKAGGTLKNGPVRRIPFSEVNWNDYQIIKTLFHRGFATLLKEGGADHPFIISKLGSVVGASDATAGVYFFNHERQHLYGIQEKIARTSRYITILTEESKSLWEKEHGKSSNLLMVPTGVDRHIPPPGQNPYREYKEKIAVYIGNLYLAAQREINLLWQNRLNSLGRLLKRKGIRLCLLGLGYVDQIDHDAVTYLGGVENDRIWDYHYFADVGIVLAQGAIQHNESSKIYYYLRAGLPVVSEAPVPNNQLIREANLGFIAAYGNNEEMAALIGEAIARTWNKKRAIHQIVEKHTWDFRALVYQEVITKELACRPSKGLKSGQASCEMAK